MENLYILNSVIFLSPLSTDEFFKVIWVPPEVKDKVLEPMTSIKEETGKLVTEEEFKTAFLPHLQDRFGIQVATGELKRDELFAYEKNRAVVYRK
jgi:long-chain acyl-CoA synthetase